MRTGFQQLPTTRKGYAGENIVSGIISASGWRVYNCPADMPHPVDFLAYKAGKGLIAVDVKTYPRRYCCPDTGLDTRDFEKYQEFERETRIPVHLVWVDEFEAAVYGARLRSLVRQASQDGGKTYFPLECMTVHRFLEPEEVDKIRQPGAIDRGRYAGVEKFFIWGRVQAMAGR